MLGFACFIVHEVFTSLFVLHVRKFLISNHFDHTAPICFSSTVSATVLSVAVPPPRNMQNSPPIRQLPQIFSFLSAGGLAQSRYRSQIKNSFGVAIWTPTLVIPLSKLNEPGESGFAVLLLSFCCTIFIYSIHYTN